MAKKKATPPRYASQYILGEAIAEQRRRVGLNLKTLGKLVRTTEQQVAKYEAGDFVPLATLEALGKALHAPIRKRIIRQISALREQEKMRNESLNALADLYQSLFTEL